MNKITYKASNVHQGHYILIDGKNTGMVINLFAYKNPLCEDYKKEVDNKIELLIKTKQDEHRSKLCNS